MAEAPFSNEQDKRPEHLHEHKNGTEDWSTGLKKLSPIPTRRERRDFQEHVPDLIGERPLFQLARPLVDLFEFDFKSPLFTPRKNSNR